MEKRKPSMFEDVVEFPEKPQQPGIWARLARAFTQAWQMAARRWLRQAKPGD